MLAIAAQPPIFIQILGISQRLPNVQGPHGFAGSNSELGKQENMQQTQTHHQHAKLLIFVANDATEGM